MDYHEISVIFLLLARLPIYCYVLHKAWVFRNSMVLISSKWLGIMALAGALGAIANAFVEPKLLVNIAGTVFSLSMFMVGLTAREVKKKQ